MRMFRWGRVVLLCVGFGSVAATAEAQTITWVTPPPETVASGGQFTVEWEASGFTGPFLNNNVGWGQRTVLGQEPGVDQGGGVYAATVTAPLLHGPLGVVVVAETAHDGPVVSTFRGVRVSAFQAIAELQASNAALQATLETLAPLADYVEVGTHNDRPVVRFTGVNVQIVDGTGETGVDDDEFEPNGLGNLIVGYDEPRPFGDPVCSDGQWTTQTECEGLGHTWAVSHKSGAHNLVVGPDNNYARYGGVVFGERNTTNGDGATVTGGRFNTASGFHASVSAGEDNTASGWTAGVTGGFVNTASARYASVSGGFLNSASGKHASVSGGQDNEASGEFSSVSAGLLNSASGFFASVSGGSHNTASGFFASVSGGTENSANHSISSVCGGAGNTASAFQSTVSGGDDLDNAVDGTVLGEGTILPAD